ncbi:hypothetical protein DIZ76_012566 [Coccidioides immitis]|nr:hypothetical protein DIZ76_012566 [Coccidioides immitis]
MHTNVALASSAVTYPLLLRAITPRNSTTAQFMKSRELLSVAHCVLVLSATLYELHQQRRDWDPHATALESERQPLSAKKNHINILEAKPPLANAILAFECGYLIQDFAVLVLGARRTASDGRARSVLARNVNWRVLGWHHLGVVAGLGMFQWRAQRGEAKGVLILLIMMLMNGSTPIGTLHWFLAKFRPGWRGSICVTHALYLATYAMVRVYLLYWIVKLFGAWTGVSALEAFRRLRWQCQLGTGVIMASNTAWLLIGIRKWVFKYLIR